MLTGRGFAGKRLPLTLAFGVLVAAAIGTGCRGFFTKPVLQSLAVGPATITIQTGAAGAAGTTQQFTAVGTYDTGTQIDSKVTWSVSPVGIASISNSGLATAEAPGQTSVTATSTEIPTIAGSTSLAVVPGGVTSVTLSGACGQTGLKQSDAFELKAKDQSGNDISPFITTWTFTAHVSGTAETGFTLGTPDSGGQPFTATWNPAPPSFPFLVDAVASLTIGTNTISSTNSCQLSFSQ
jgi:Bacterial Ig-like domain (group 2)